jgi:hypothetical protein
MDVADLVPAGGVTTRFLVRVAREPLLHFVCLGALLLALHRRMTPPLANRIVVGASVVQSLREEHRRRAGKPPTPDEEAALVARWVDGEVLYREALALGLDRNDLIVRRRMVQKVTFLTEDVEPIPAPTDADLAAFLAAHADRYTAPLRLTLTHVFVSTDRHPDDAEAIATSLRARLEAGLEPEGLGDPFLRGRDFRLQNERELAAVFGAPFAAAVTALPAGAWSDPVRSSYGFHLVNVSERRPGRVPSLAEVRDAVARDWRDERRDAINRAALERLRARYQVVVEEPASR